jgi:5-methyltetrahydrofolate--homocysteine methyltransferase
MKKAVAYLEPYMDKDKAGGSSQGKIVMATVKGDVHDIGKNIVGVVLGCNRYEVIDLGVMVSSDKILQTAVDEGCNVIGLSGLITPSLDEMVNVAKEMERREIRLPLLIGGATTSRQHTAVKIAPQYEESVVYVQDASRVVGVMSQILDPKRKGDFDIDNRDEQERLRAIHADRGQRKLVSLEQARATRPKFDWASAEIDRPSYTGRKQWRDIALEEIVPYIDWTFFFSAWELKGRYPKILDDPTVGEAARELYENGRELLDEIIEGKLLTANAVTAFWPAASDGDDIVVFSDESRSSVLARFPMLRQQATLERGVPHRSLADFVAPIDSGREDWIGGFAVTAGIGADKLAAHYEADHDDYRAILVKALADRLAEALAEKMHAQARVDWGYGRAESFDNDELISERYRGIRPAFGYPACPDHLPKRTLFKLLEASELGLNLTESCAMTPAASVSGLYFASPEARYFSVGRIDRAQVVDYAGRSGCEPVFIERWLQANLGYDPDDR